MEYSSEKTATVVGKPNPAFLRLAAQSITNDPILNSCWVIGDDATTDIPMGRSANMRTIQVKTGKYSTQRSNETMQADYVIGSLADLPKLMKDLF